MAALRQRLFGGDSSKDSTNANATAVDDGELSDGSLKYVVETGGNDAPPTYQEASGAPVESQSPLGYSVGPITILFLNISKMIGVGVYSTRKKVGSSRPGRVC
jgi:hypothetical protein